MANFHGIFTTKTPKLLWNGRKKATAQSSPADPGAGREELEDARAREVRLGSLRRRSQVEGGAAGGVGTKSDQREKWQESHDQSHDNDAMRTLGAVLLTVCTILPCLNWYCHHFNAWSFMAIQWQSSLESKVWAAGDSLA